MRKSIEIGLFLLIGLLISLPIYRDAMWGGSLLAPLDLGPDFYTNYKFMDPSSTGIPDNHYIIDQFNYDLPLQQAIYRAYHSGEIPWWDPYTFGGRPLLADAHVNGTDPLRLLCYAALPFDLAYNWNYILRGIVSSLGMYLLLRHLGVRPIVAGIMGIAYQYAGWFTLYFGHPWIQGSFLYYPFLWIAWMRATEGSWGRNTAVAAILCAFVFYAGNLQSHAYLPIFALTFLGSCLIKNRVLWKRSVATCAFSGMTGALLAYPVLVNQIEFFLIGIRSTTSTAAWYSNLANAPVALAAVYPWCLGTFRTLDVAQAIGAGGMAFTLFCGSIPAFLAIFGGWRLCRETGIRGWAATQALLLVAVFLLVVSTPLSSILYTRCAALAGMGLIVVAALTMDDILAKRYFPRPTLVRAFAGLTLSAAVGASLLAWFAYPHVKDYVERKVKGELAGLSSLSSLPAIDKLRSFQISNFPNEVSLVNPEAAISLISVLTFSFALLSVRGKYRRAILVVALCGSVTPVLMFHARFRPKHPITLWNRMTEGGPAQLNAMRLTAGGLRIDERTSPWSDMIFPHATAALYRVHAVLGYSALQPPSLLRPPKNSPPPPDGWTADLLPTNTGSPPLLKMAVGGSPSRFRISATGHAAPVHILDESFDTLTLDASDLPPNTSVIRTDTWYPGWTPSSGLSLKNSKGIFTEISPTLAEPPKIWKFTYTPTGTKGAFPAVVLAMAIVLLLLLIPSLQQPIRFGINIRESPFH
jgi:hypothetical protein